MTDISLDQARKALEAAEKKAIEIGTKMDIAIVDAGANLKACLLYTSPSPRDQRGSRMPSSA